jgi:hypothetical protein
MRNLILVLESPKSLEALGREEVEAALAELARVRGRLSARLDALASTVQEPRRQTLPQDRLLTPADVAERMGVSVRWVYRHANQWPFTRRLSRKVLRFSEAGLAKHLSRQRDGGLTV